MSPALSTPDRTLRPAVQLADPFGEDAVDFEIEQFLKGAYVNTVAHLQTPKLTGCGYVPADQIGSVDLSKPADENWVPKPPELGPTRFGFTKT